MKRAQYHLSLALASLVTFVGSVQADDAAEKKDADQVPVALHGTPKIDGEVDDAWAKCPEIAVDKIVSGESTASKDTMATAKVKLLWDDEHIYALFHVKDSKLSDSGSQAYEQDSIEFFVDELNQKAGTYQEDDVQYRVAFNGDKSGGESYDEGDLKSAVKKTDDGYIVELAVKLSHVKPKEGTKIGIELQVNDNDGSGSRVAIAKFHHDENDSYQSTTDFGTVELKD